MSEITQSALKEALLYDRLTGRFTFLRPKGSNNAGDKAGYLDAANGYMRISLFGKRYWLHRLAWLYVHGVMPENQIDHINHDKQDNSITNLREATNKDNQRNSGVRKDNSSGVVGVSFANARRKWQAQIKVDGENIYLGQYADIQDAIAARKNADIKYGFHENHGANTLLANDKDGE